MIIIMKEETTNEQLQSLMESLQEAGLEIGITSGVGHKILGLIRNVPCG